MEQRDILSIGTAGGCRLTPDAIASALGRGLNPRGRSDDDLERRLAGMPPGMPRPGDPFGAPDELTPAAVLVPLVDRPEGLSVMLTRRTAHLVHHPGQISFPGGRLEAADNGDATVCALRETTEEVGLDPAFVTILGRLDDYVTGTGFIVTPLVGLVRPGFTLVLDDFEVAEVFEVPLSFVLDQGNHQLHHREIKGRPRPFWAMSWEDRLIWGATAGMLVNLSDVLAHGGG